MTATHRTGIEELEARILYSADAALLLGGVPMADVRSVDTARSDGAEAAAAVQQARWLVVDRRVEDWDLVLADRQAQATADAPAPSVLLIDGGVDGLARLAELPPDAEVLPWFDADGRRWLGAAALDDVLPDVLPESQPEAVATAVSTVSAVSEDWQAEVRHELVVIDGGIDGASQLAMMWWSRATSACQIEVVVTDPLADGLAQVSALLASRQNLSAVHLVSHGDTALLQLGRTAVDAALLAARAEEVAGWRQALTDDADLLLYGCDVGQGLDGAAFVHQLGNLTGADVAASTDLTGSAEAGGDWELELQTGRIDDSARFEPTAQALWQGTLATYTVTNLNDSGAGSLRQAITNANANGGADTIAFSTFGTINLASALPQITGRVTINGTNGGVPGIVLHGGHSVTTGLDFQAGSDSSVLRGLVLHSFTGAGIAISDSSGVTVAGNYIGTDVNGNFSLVNGIGVNLFNAANTRIGGTVAADRNVISGNGNIGVNIVGAGSVGTVVQGNYIGTNAAGSADVGNTWHGVFVNAVSGVTIGGSVAGAGNVVSGNGTGITLESSATGNVVAGNTVGLNAAGTGSLANADAGIRVLGSFNTIGGTTTAARNVVSGNTTFGINLSGASAMGNTVLGNYIGTSTSGNVAQGNGQDGIQIDTGASNNTIGGTVAGAGNIIAGNNQSGIAVENAASTGNQILGNWIGVGSNGSTAVANSQSGIHVAGATGTLIGNSTAAGRNVVTYNTGRGIYVDAAVNTGIRGNWVISNGLSGITVDNNSSGAVIGGDTQASANLIVGNSNDGILVTANGSNTASILANNIYSNVQRGIDLGDNGYDSNDNLDPDTGPNGYQNFPVLSSVSGDTSGTTVNGSLNSTAGHTFRIDFYSNRPGNTDGTNGEGARWLGFTTVTTNGSGNASINASLAGVYVNHGDRVTATATRDLGGGNYGGTSEFAANVTANTSGVVVVDTTSDTSDGTTTSITGLGNARGGDGRVSLREAMAAVNNTTNGASPDRIVFAIPTNIESANINTALLTPSITLGSALTTMTQAVVIDATTDNRFAASGNRPAIVLDGANVVQDGLRLYTGADGSTVRGLIVQRFTQDGLDISDSGGHTVAGNWFGVGTDGVTARGNQQGVNIWNSNNNVIGGDTAADRNLISANTGTGVWIGGGATGNQIRGNYIGTTEGGDAALGNAVNGVLIESAGNTVGGTTAGQRNVIAANGSAGVKLGTASATGNVVIGNYIGTDLTGTTDLNGAAQTNGVSGVVIMGGASSNRIGTNADGTNDTAERNLISGNNWYGVEMVGTGTASNVVQGNYIGTDVTGLVALGNAQGGVAFWGGATGNQVGSGLTGAGNVISGNETGVLVANGSTNNRVQGNLIGLGTDGSTAVGNTGAGVYLYNGGFALAVTGNLIGTNADGSTDAAERNVISANYNGVALADAEISGNTVAGNYIGTDATGLLDRGNTFDGVQITGGANANTVGGTLVAQRNVISGNGDNAVKIASEASDGNTVIGNWLGLNAAGTGVLGNSGDGIFISGGADNSVIGGTGANSGNWIAGAGLVGIEIDGASSGTLVHGNRIGTDLAGTANWGTQQNGILVENGATSSQIGGTAAGAGNVIAFSGQGGTWTSGVSISGNSTTGNAVLGNTVYSNVGLGLDLGSAGVRANDTGDADFGPNNLQNFPVLNTARTDGSTQLLLTGTLNSSASSYYRIEFFANTSQDATGYGEGQRYLGYANVATNASGNATISTTLSASVAVGESISATATKSDATYTTFTDTSEFARSIAAVSSAQAVITVDTAADTSDGDTSSLSTLLANKGADGFISLREAITAANNTANGSSADRITFAIAGTGVHTITVATALPSVTGAVVLDASTDDSFAANGQRAAIVLDGNGISASGLTLAAGSGGSTVRGFSLVDFGLYGLNIDAGSDGNTVEGNVIGLLADGSTAAANNLGGLAVQSSNNTIGGTTTLARNVLSSNVNAGVWLAGSNNVVIGNYIGTDATGTLARGNAQDGLFIPSGANNRIGGTSAAERNIISANTRHGFEIFGAGTSGTLVQGNYIGTDVTGTQALGNWAGAFWFGMGTSQHTVGGTATGSGNLIANNLSWGNDGAISVEADVSGIAVLGNSIVGNAGLGIDLGMDGVTANDTGDGDTGANSLQNRPTLTSATLTATQITLNGSLSSGLNTLYRLEFFANATGDASGSGEGQTYLGYSVVKTDGAGSAGFSVVLDQAVAAGQAISATATNLSTGDTSEFAANVIASGPNTAPSFSNSDGKVVQDLGGGTSDFTLGMAKQADGKLVTVGYTQAANQELAVQRWNVDGTLDTSFGTGGQFTLAIGLSNDFATAVKVLDDGKLVVAGQTFNGSIFVSALVKLNADGTLDTSFGGGDGVATGSNSVSNQSGSLAIQTDGKILLAAGNSDFVVQRFNVNGSVDASFGTSGVAAIDLAGSTDLARSIEVQTDGRLVVGGTALNGGQFDFAVVRLLANGSLDTSFNGTGMRLLDIGTNSSDMAYAMALQSNGAIVLTGWSDASGSTTFATVRLTSAGALDTSFNGTGTVTTDIGAGSELGVTVAVQADGKIVIAGQAGSNGNDFALVRYTSAGALDTTFNGTGRVNTDFGSSSDDRGAALQLLADGQIVLAGTSNLGGSYNLAIARYNSAGALDRGFDAGNAAYTLGNTIAYAENSAAVVIDSNATVVDRELFATDSFSGATLTLARNGGANAQDVFSATGTLSAISAASGNVVLSGTTIGTYTNSAGTLVFTFNASATNARVNSAMQQIAYANSSDAPPATVQINWTLNDGNTGAQGTGGALAVVGSSTVNITGVNDAPALDLSGAQSLPTNGSRVFSAGNGNALTVSDVDNGAGLLQLTLSVSTGSFTLASISGLVFSTGDGTADASMVFTGSQTNINAALNGASYQPPANYNGSANLSLTVNDQGNTGSGGALQASGSVLMQVGALQFQQGANSYSGAQDVRIVSGTPSTNYGNETAIYQNAGEQVLIRFDSLFGSGPGQIPAGATITSASLTLYLDNIGTGSATMHQLLGLTWNQATATWNSTGNGVQLDGVEAAATPVSTLASNSNGFNTFTGLETSLQSWADGTTNQGWVINKAGSDWRYHSSENASAALRPYLTVSYTTPTAPVVSPTGGSAAYTENAAAVAVDAGLLLTDADSTLLTGASVQITTGYVASQDLLGFISQNGISGNWNGTTGLLTLSGQATLAQYQAALRSVTYVNNSEAPSTATRTLEFTATDAYSTLTSAAATRTLTVTAVNDAPAFTGLDGTPSSTENAAAVVLDANVTIADAELGAADNFNGATLTLVRNGGANVSDVFYATGTLRALYEGAALNLNGTVVGSITTNSNGTLALIFNSTATGANVNAVMQQIGYGNNSDTPPASAQIDWLFSDGNSGPQGSGGALTTLGSTTVSFNAINDAPTFGPNLITNGSFDTDLGAWTVSASVTRLSTGELTFGASDQVGPHTASQVLATQAGVTYALSFDYRDGNNTRNQSLQVAVDGAGNLLTTGQIVTSVPSSDAVRYTYTFTANSAATTITFTDTSDTAGVADGSLYVDGHLDNIAVRQVSGTLSAANYAENGAAVVLQPVAQVFDAELTAANNFNGATLTLARNGGANSQDVFSATGTLGSISAASGNLVSGGVTIGTYTNSAGTLVFTFNASATNARVNSALQQIAYANSSDAPPASVQIDWTFSDGNTGGQGSGGALAATGSTTVMVTAVNDAPVLTLYAPSYATTENAVPFVVSVATVLNGHLSDADAGAAGGLALYALAGSGGDFSYSLDGGTSWNSVPAVAPGSALLLRATDQIRILPSTTNGGTVLLDYRGWDQTSGTAGTLADATTVGGATAFSAASERATVTITSVNDAPVLSDTPLTLSVAEDAGLPSGVVGALVGAFTGGTGDVDTGAVRGIALTATDETHGAWYYSTNAGASWTGVGAVSDSAALLLADNGATRLYFAPTANFSGSSLAALTLRAWDTTSGSAGTKVSTASNGGTTAFSSATDTVDVTVTAFNDAPVGLYVVPGVTGANLVAVYGFDTTAQPGRDDGSGHLDMALSGNPGSTTAVDGSQALQLSGGQYGTVPGFVSGGSMSFAAEVRFDTTGDWQRVFDFGEADSGGIGAIYVGRMGISNDLTFTIEKSGSYDYRATAVNVITDGVWMHFVATVDGSGEMKLYINGTLTGTGTGVVPETGVRPVQYVGKSNWSGDAAFEGAIDHFVIAQGVFSAQDVATLYQQSQGLHVDELATTGTVLGTVAGSDPDAAAPGSYSLIDDAGGRFAIDASTGTLTVADGSRLDFEAAARHDVTVRFTDSVGASLDVVLSIHLRAVNEAPVFSGLGGSVGYTEGAAGVALAPTASLADAELGAADDFTGATLTLARQGGANAEDQLAFDGTVVTVSGANLFVGGTQVGTYVFTGGQLDVTLSSGATQARVDTLLRHIVYWNSSDTPPASVRIDWTFRDGNTGAQGTGGSLTGTGHTVVVIAAVSDAPVVTVSGSSGTYVENAPALFDAVATVTDVDSADFDGGVLAYMVTANGSASDELAIRDEGTGAGQIGLSGNDVTYGGVVIGTHAGFGNGSTPLVVTFNSNASVTAVQALLRNLTYRNSSDDPGSATRTVQIDLSDGDGASITPIVGTIALTPVNDAPVITSLGGGATAALSLAENTTAVVTVTASDVDLGAASFSYSITGGADAARFTIDAATGVLSFLAAPDHEAPGDANTDNVYDVTVQVSDGSLTDTQVIAVTVTAVNDNTPAITSGSAVSVAENTTAVMTVTGTDADLPAQTLTFSIAGGADATRFTIDAATGALSFLAAPDHEAPSDADTDNVYDVTVQVSDGSLTTSQAIAVTITPVNDNAPAITSGSTASIVENTTAVMTVTATDVDVPAQTLTFSITGGADAARFTIDAATGVLSFLPAPDHEAPGDADTDNVYDVTVQVSDGGLTSSQAIAVMVTAVNDNAPSITSGSTASVAENTTAVMTVMATDADLPVQTLTFSITGGADAARFTIDAATGVLSFLAAPDHEAPSDANADNVYDVTVQVSDGSLTTSQAIAVTVTALNDNTPAITSGSVVSVAENTTAVTTVTATDSDLPAQTLTFSIIGGADAARFTIDAATGALSFLAAPDHEAPSDANADNVYDVTVQVSDGSLTTSQAIAVTVTALNDNTPTITSGSAVSVAENTTAVTTVTATDADLPAQTLTFSIIGGADAARFTIDAATGVLSFLAAPDHEAPSDANADNVYDVTVQVSDGSLIDTQAIAVTVTAVNDNTPAITSGNAVSVAENTTAVTTVMVADADLPAQTLTFSITGGADAARFTIDAATGALSFLAAPDYEAPSDANADNVYDVTVQVSDGSLTSSQTIAVTVTAVNDNTPTITSGSAVSVAENTTAVTTVTATDSDLPAQTLMFSITGGADGDRFTIDAATGVLSFLAAPDHEAPSDANADNVYDVTVQVSDGSLTSSQVIAVTVTAVNDNTPAITSGSAVSVAENTTAVTTVTATDADLPGQTLTFSITGGGDAARFTIDAATGALSFLAAPDHEAPSDANADNVYDVTVQVSDGSLTTSQSIAVTITATNDNTPTITSGSAVSVSENTTAVTTVTATDSDLPAQTLTFSITGGADGDRFTIDAATGVLSFLAAPDHEAPSDANADNVYDVTVQVSDGSLTTSQAIAVRVTALNDNTPAITSGSVVSVAENTTAVTTVTATDADLPAQTLTFSIIGGADAARFTIDAATGVLSFLAAPDHEAPSDANADNVYDVTVQVSDGSLTALHAIAVTVTAVNDNTPAITSGSAVSVAENTTAVTTVTATDADLSAQTLTFSIIGGADAARFTIDAATGVLSFLAAPDHEAPSDANADNVYDVTVQVSDGSLTTSQAIAVTVTAVNDNTPAITSGSVVSVAENTTAVTTVTATDSDLPAQTLMFSITGGADAARFTIDAATGALSFLVAPDYEASGDANADNVYDVTVQVSDGGLTSSQAIAVMVTAVNDNTPAITSGSAVSVSENTTAVTTVTATDSDLPAQTLMFSITGGADGDRFTIDAATGVLSFLAAPDHEVPSDANADNIYDVTVQVSDGSLTSSQAIAVTVTAVNDNAPRFTSDWATPDVSIMTPEGERWSAAVSVADADLPAQGLRFDISGGADAALFELDPVTGLLGFRPIADAESPQDADQDNAYEVEITVGDGEFTVRRTLTLLIANVNEAPVLLASQVSVGQGGRVTLDASMLTSTDPDTDATALVYTVSDVQSGAFVRVAAPDQAIDRFTQAEVLAGKVVFVQSGAGPDATRFDLTVSDGGWTVGPRRVSVQVQPAAPVPTPVTELPPVLEAAFIVPVQDSNRIDEPLTGAADSRVRLDQIMIEIAGNGRLAPAVSEDVASSDSPVIAATQSTPTTTPVTSTTAGPARRIGPMPDLLPGARATPYADAESSSVVPDLSRLPASDLLVMLDVPIDLSGFLQERMALLQWASLEERSRAAVESAQQQQGRDQTPALRWDSGDTVQAGGMALSVGLVFWATRASGLIASLAAVAPPWRQFDPLPVLSVHAPRQPEGTEVEWLDTDIPGSLADLAEDMLDHRT
ncbi:cadherin domain-containing protein [Sphaerotilus sp.]|uniref:cadherin domain-containing protein n=1 Tax=Sphaerotilus sp. TaxID=2093942 RepID=UPI002ACEB568|nr:cadherin domain-containing protein [Sphaerotilus sp.]MDZ7858116.1 cadherin domain-containing protein [Sphaerotilus sp.]